MTAYAISATTIKLRFPAFIRTPDSQIEFAIEEAALSVDRNVFTISPTSDWYITAFCYLAAHYLMVQIQRMASGTGQVIQSMNVGGEISYTFAPIEQPTRAEFSDLATTAFGARFLEICALVQPAVAVV